MEGRSEATRRPPATAARTLPTWLLGLFPLALLAAGIAALSVAGGPGLGERRGPPVESLAVERTVLQPGRIELTVRNDGPDPVEIAQVAINDAFVNFTASAREVGRLQAERLTIPYDWIEGEAYEVALLTSTGATIDHSIDVAVETPTGDLGFFGLMALLGVYVGVIPVALGMLWLPFARRVREDWLRMLMAITVGLLAFLAGDAALEGLELAGESAGAFGGPLLVFLGAAASYLALAAIEAYLARRRQRARAAGVGGIHLALLVAIGIGLHNLGEGLAIGSAYAIGALALGGFLVVGFAIHNSTEGLAIVAPVAGEPPPLSRLVGLGLLAGAPVILGAWIGAAAFNPAAAAFLLGMGAGAIVAVIQQLVPAIRDSDGRALNPVSAGGIAAGVAILYVTGLLVSV
jgi:ZIP family zinc transporter